MMKKEVNLHFSSTSRGPGRVVENLARGLVENGWNVYANDIPRLGTYQGCLQMVPAINSLGRDSLMGPNLFVVPSEWGDFCQRFNRFIVPSEWVKNKYAEYRELSHASVDVWPVGIDTELWTKSSSNEKPKVLVYFKSREQSELDSITQKLENLSVDFRVLKYGSYEEKDLYESCIECNCCILLTGTESQGIAYMQILSMGLPIYAVNKSKFDYFGRYKDAPIEATSVPYFDKSCGFVDDHFIEENFLRFLSSLSSFDPGSYIRDRFTIKRCAKEYIDILENSKS
jgi:glycosyltransferase involved in cell wall biosynthesis